MTELVSSNGNYCAYRKAFNECEGFKIPILGVHLKDLIAVHVVFPDWVENRKVNLVKMQQLYMTFSELVALQSAQAHVEPNMDLIHLLTVRGLCTDKLSYESFIHYIMCDWCVSNPSTATDTHTTDSTYTYRRHKLYMCSTHPLYRRLTNMLYVHKHTHLHLHASRCPCC